MTAGAILVARSPVTPLRLSLVSRKSATIINQVRCQLPTASTLSLIFPPATSDRVNGRAALLLRLTDTSPTSLINIEPH